MYTIVFSPYKVLFACYVIISSIYYVFVYRGVRDYYVYNLFIGFRGSFKSKVLRMKINAIIVSIYYCNCV